MNIYKSFPLFTLKYEYTFDCWFFLTVNSNGVLRGDSITCIYGKLWSSDTNEKTKRLIQNVMVHRSALLTRVLLIFTYLRVSAHWVRLLPFRLLVSWCGQPAFLSMVTIFRNFFLLAMSSAVYPNWSTRGEL